MSVHRSYQFIACVFILLTCMQSCKASLQFANTSMTFETGQIRYRKNDWDKTIQGFAVLFDEQHTDNVKNSVAFVKHQDKPTNQIIRQIARFEPLAVVLEGERSPGWGQYRIIGDTSDIKTPAVEISSDDFNVISKMLMKGNGQEQAILTQDHVNDWRRYTQDSILFLLFFTLLPILHNVVNLGLTVLVYRRLKSRKRTVFNLLGVILLLQILASLARIIYFLDPIGVHSIITYRANDIVSTAFLPFMLAALILSTLHWRENFKAKKLLNHSMASSLHPFIYIAAVSIFPMEVLAIVFRAIGSWSTTAAIVWGCLYGGLFFLFGVFYQFTAFQAWRNFSKLVKLNKDNWGCVPISRLVFFVIIGLVLELQMILGLIWSFTRAWYYPLSFLAVSGTTLYLLTTECTLQLITHLIKRRIKPKKLSNLANSTQTDSHAMGDMTLSGHGACSSESSYSPSIDYTASNRSVTSSDLLSASTSSNAVQKQV